ncbi:unnamed protein product [Gongylonema pulchrum]|uniref:E1_dh domain-containing protein n=1 Tax=Gongylonema pulchrum TaxID=637853 RepID=A0A183E2J7_9BILA|nr:unnamed protein product [Gongylonema pulchrum]
MMNVISNIFKAAKVPVQQQPFIAFSFRLLSNEASFQTKPYKLHRLESGPSANVSVTRDDAVDYYRKMAKIRRMETAAGNLYKERLVRGFCHLYAGQGHGRRTGNVHGKGGSMHMYNKNFFGGNGIVGAQQAIGAGLAFAQKYNKKKNVSFTLFGDGAANQGQLYEGCYFWCVSKMH